MGCSIERVMLAVCAVVAAQGCVTGHMLDYAREIERPVAYRAASLDRDRLHLAYDTVVIDERGRRLGRRVRHAAVRLADLARGDLPVDDFPLVRMADDAPLPGRPVALDHGRDSLPSLEIETAPDGRQTSFVLRGTDAPYPAFQSAALSRTHVAPWIYPLLPLGLVIDAVSNPVLLFFAPAVMVIGD
jgi:hypothetical protein